MATNEGGGAAARPAARRPAPAALPAFVLHSHDWSESSLIVELLTRPLGRVVVVAKGAKKPTSNFRAVLLPFAPLAVAFGRAPADDAAEIRTLRSAEWAGGAPLLRGDALLAGFYCNELLLRLLARNDPHQALFDAYADTLAALAGNADDAAALRAFELLLLRQLGWLPELDRATLTAQALLPQQRYTLSPDAGLVTNARGIAGEHWLLLEPALAHGANALRAACAPVAGELRGPLRDLLHYHLGDARLRTRQVWQGLQRLARTA